MNFQYAKEEKNYGIFILFYRINQYVNDSVHRHLILRRGIYYRSIICERSVDI